MLLYPFYGLNKPQLVASAKSMHGCLETSVFGAVRLSVYEIAFDCMNSGEIESL